MDGSTWFSLAVLIIIGAAIYFMVKDSRARAAERAATAAKEQAAAQAAVEKIEAANGDITKLPDLTDQVRNVILHPGERCFAICRGAQHVVEAHSTKFVGGSHGVSIRIAKGVRYRVGGFSGQPVVRSYEKIQDSGDLYITSQRVVFAGTREVTSIAGDKVADVRIDGDHIWVIAENRKTPLGLKLTPAVAPVMAYAARLLAESCQSGGK